MPVPSLTWPDSLSSGLSVPYALTETLVSPFTSLASPSFGRISFQPPHPLDHVSIRLLISSSCHFPPILLPPLPSKCTQLASHSLHGCHLPFPQILFWALPPLVSDSVPLWLYYHQDLCLRWLHLGLGFKVHHSGPPTHHGIAPLALIVGDSWIWAWRSSAIHFED